MSEEEQVQEVAEVTQVNDQTPEQPVEATETPAEEPKQTQVRKDKEYNFSELRKQKEAAERAYEIERQRNQEMFEMLKQHRQPQTQQEKDFLEEELSKLSKDDLATIDNVDKKLTKAQRMSKKETEMLNQKIEQLEAKLEEQMLKTKFPDLDDVLSSENIEALKKEDPEIANMIAQMQNPKEKATMAYKYIKKLIPQKQPDNQERKIAADNSSKPRSVQSIKNTSPIGMANAFATMNPTKEEKAAIWKQMQEDMKRG